jgi:heptosyltransferase III
MLIFVYRPGAIGDTILTLPALAALRRRYPGCHIAYAGNAAMLPLLPVEQGLSADDTRLLPLFGDPPRPWPEADLHVVFARQPTGLPGIQHDPLAALERGVHMADWLVDAVDPFYPDREPRLTLTPEDHPQRGRIAATGEPELPTRTRGVSEPGEGAQLVIHPGAGSAFKRWPAERFKALADELGLPLAVVRGPADPPFELECPHQLWQSLPLPELARRLKGSGVFVGNDSGITHLAAVVGAPTLAIYVNTEPAVWGIRGRHTRRLQGDVSVAEAIAAALELRRVQGRTT